MKQIDPDLTFSTDVNYRRGLRGGKRPAEGSRRSGWNGQLARMMLLRSGRVAALLLSAMMPVTTGTGISRCVGRVDIDV